MTPKTLIFDFGNVVGFFDHNIAVRKLAEYTHLSPDALHALLYRTPLEDRYERGDLTTEQFFAEAAGIAGLRCDAETFERLYANVFTINPIVAELVPQLAKQHRLLLASNTNAAHVGQFRTQFAEVLRHFSFIGLSQEARARKPEHAFYAHVHAYADCLPGECLFIDDLADNLAGASAFGWQTLLYSDDLAARLRQEGVRGCGDVP